MARRFRNRCRIVVYIVSAALALFGAGLGLVGCLLSASGYQGANSRNFDGTRFHNVPNRPHPGVGDGLKWQIG